MATLPSSPLPVVGVTIGPQWASMINVAIAELQSMVGDLSVQRSVGFFGAVGDGVHDDTAAINAAIASLPVGTPGGGVVTFNAGTYLISGMILIPNGVELRGQGPQATIIKLANGFSNTLGVGNATQNGSQQTAFISDLTIDGNKANGTGCSDALVSFVSLYETTRIRNVVIQNSPSRGLHIGANNGAGPILVDSCTISGSASHNVQIDEAVSNTGVVGGIHLRNCTINDQAGGTYGIYIHGQTRLYGVNITGCHIEQANFATAGTKAIYIDGADYLNIDMCQIYGGSAAGIVVTNNSQNVGIIFKQITNQNAINPILDDQFRTVQFGAVHLPFYSSKEHGVLSSHVQTLTYSASVSINMLLGNVCKMDVTNTSAFTLNSPTNAQDGDIITLEISNQSGGAMGVITWPASFVYRDSSWTNPASTKRRVIAFRNRGNNQWAQMGPATGDM